MHFILHVGLLSKMITHNFSNANTLLRIKIENIC